MKITNLLPSLKKSNKRCGLQGILRNGTVAVKKLSEIKWVKGQIRDKKFRRQKEDFQREVSYLMKVKHKNIVRFLGYCYEAQYELVPDEEEPDEEVWQDETRKMFLCYEFLPNGTLADYIKGRISNIHLLFMVTPNFFELLYLLKLLT